MNGFFTFITNVYYIYDAHDAAAAAVADYDFESDALAIQLPNRKRGGGGELLKPVNQSITKALVAELL